MVVTRFAPSPTGYLHIGGARTALYNWLYARHHCGKFLLRIEDTDRERSTRDAVDKIFESLKWLGLNWDDKAVFQFARSHMHAKIALDLVAKGKAYFCYCTPEELEQMRQLALAEGKSPKYNGMWRYKDPAEAPNGIKPVVRLKSNLVGTSVLNDLVQGKVEIENKELDDFVLLRSDGTPTYMLSVVVDDHDMGITHVIRGDDHLTNTFRQMQIYEACGWQTPVFGHIPLIHGSDGAKLSKRHGALGVENYKDMGFLPEAMCNYLLRLGWSHGDDELISREQAIEWFDSDKLGKSPSRLDLVKLTNMNSHYIKIANSERIFEEIRPMIELELGRSLSNNESARILLIMPEMQKRAKLLTDICELSKIFLDDRDLYNASEEEKVALSKVVKVISNTEWTAEALENALRKLADDEGEKFGKFAGLARLALSNSKVSPGVFEMMCAFGKDESVRRLLG